MEIQQFHTKFTFLSDNQNEVQSTQIEDKKVRQWGLIGVGSGWGAQNMGTADGPKVLMDNVPEIFQSCPKLLTYWHKMPLNFANSIPLASIETQIHADHVFEVTTHLCEQVKNTLIQGSTPLVFGGDHSIAIGTWSGVKAAIGQEDLGLIWIDAHLDAHVPETSPSHNVHGMPVAALLGHGEERFTKLGGPSPKIKPENVCLIGIRSYEEGEENLLKQLGVKIYLMKEVQDRGFQAIFEEARSRISARLFGLSIDVDAFDPEEAPGTGTPEATGLWFQEVKDTLYGLAQDSNLIAIEITEYNPHRDQDHKTARLVWNIARTITGDLS